MLNKQILKKREELNNSIINGANYDVVYKLSIESYILNIEKSSRLAKKRMNPFVFPLLIRTFVAH